MSTQYTDSHYQTYLEETLGDLDGQEYRAVEAGSGDRTVKVSDTPANAIGVMWNKLQPSGGGQKDGSVTVRKFGGGGTFKGIAGSTPPTSGALVTTDSAGAFTTAGTGAHAVGRVETTGTIAAGDVIEISDAPQQVP